LYVPEELRLKNPEEVITEITNFIKSYVNRARASGVVVGLSGGVDSSTVLALAIRALGKDRVFGLIMPLRFTPKRDIEDAVELAKSFGVKYKLVQIDNIENSYKESLGVVESPDLKIPFANLRARIRMTILYFYANSLNYLVMGTGDKSELLIGYFTKYGDGGVDFLPIGHLYKTQVRQLALALGIPRHIALKPSSPQLYPGHKAIDEIPLDYDKLDLILYYLFDKNMNPHDIAKHLGFSIDVINRIIEMHINSFHKREPPPTLRPLPKLSISDR